MAINSNPNRKIEESMPVTDEGWWESVLAEERRHAPPTARPRPSAENASPAAADTPEPDAPAETPAADWERARQLFREDRILPVKVVGHNRGGLLVDGDGLAGFLPYSHVVELAGRSDIVDREKSLENYRDQELQVKIIECVPEEGRVVFSERAALSEPGTRFELFESLKPGQRVQGRVTNITDFGVFVDLGGVEGLIHISELSWGRVRHPSGVVSPGEVLEVEVLDLSAERCRVALSLKRILPNPWERASTEFGEGRVLAAEITSVRSYGAFARLEAGIEGLIHASEMPIADGQSPRDILEEGQQVQVRVLHVDSAHQRMGLSLQVNS